MVEAFYLSAENFPKTMFLAMTYVQAFLIVTFVAGLLSNWFFHGTLVASSCIRTILHILGLLVYGIFLKRSLRKCEMM